MSTTAPLVQLSYNDLLEGKDVTQDVYTAFGPDGLGALMVTGVPELVDTREQALTQVRLFSQLPDETKTKYEVPPVYHRGWDTGHEEMKKGIKDFSKGSYYYNPTNDNFDDLPAEAKEKHALCFTPNIFPTTELPDFEAHCKAMSSKIIQVGTLVAKQCDMLVAKQVPSYKTNTLESIVRDGGHHLCRGLHYFPPTDVIQADDNWCGWHNDHGALTGLTVATFTNSAGQTVVNPDSEAGLHIKTRAGDMVRVKAPKDAMLFQIGETMQILSGGLLRATPHMVKAPATRESIGVARTTMALFMQPDPDYPLKMPADSPQTSTALINKHLPASAPPLDTRYVPDKDTFGDFSFRSIQAYYALKQSLFQTEAEVPPPLDDDEQPPFSEQQTAENRTD